MYNSLKWPRLNIRRHIHWLQLIFKRVHFNYPHYLQQFLVPYSSIADTFNSHFISAGSIFDSSKTGVYFIRGNSEPVPCCPAQLFNRLDWKKSSGSDKFFLNFLKIAAVLPFLEGRDPSDLNNYRPIWRFDDGGGERCLTCWSEIFHRRSVGLRSDDYEGHSIWFTSCQENSSHLYGSTCICYISFSFNLPPICILIMP